MDIWSLMESDINSEVHRSPDDIPEKGCVHILIQIVCHNLRNTALVYISVHNSVTFTLDHTLLMLTLRGQERKKKKQTQNLVAVSAQEEGKILPNNIFPLRHIVHQ